MRIICVEIKALEDLDGPYIDITHAVLHLHLHIFQLYLRMCCTCVSIKAKVKSKPLWK